MATTVMVYGADEFMGELIVDRLLALSPFVPTLVLSGLDTARLTDLGTTRNLEVRPFDWQDEGALSQELDQVDLVVNAATPFEETVEVLGNAAIAAGCHYVDANTELDSEIRLASLDSAATAANVTLASAAGPTGALTDMLVDAALTRLESRSLINASRRIGAIRIAISCLSGFSRSSAQSAYRASTRAVLTLRVEGSSGNRHVDIDSQPVGQRERPFDFSPGGSTGKPVICAGANLTDAFAAARAAIRHDVAVGSIECFVAMNEWSRLAYPMAAALHAATGPAWLYGLDAVVDRSFALLPRGPAAAVRTLEPFTLLLTIEDELKVPLVDWRLTVPSFYDVGAEIVAGMVNGVVGAGRIGVVTPSMLGVGARNSEPIQFPLAPDVALDRRVCA